MPEQTVPTTNQSRIPGFDAEATPLLGLGLGLTGLALGLRPRLAPLPLAITALAALFYRDPNRTTPDDPSAVFAATDGTVQSIEPFYEHRFLHTDAVRIVVALSPLDVAVIRSPASGTVRYIERVSGEFRPTRDAEATERNERTYIGIETAWGPFMVVQIAGPFARRTVCRVHLGDRIDGGERIGTARFGARVDLVLPRDAIDLLATSGQTLKGGLTSVGRVALAQ